MCVHIDAVATVRRPADGGGCGPGDGHSDRGGAGRGDRGECSDQGGGGGGGGGGGDV